eukprot:gnl/MRDRNA2_/MRDRNA2_116217_c0_seq1.p1 gnl/MRDRNA2_/MRDRNA2_116217_c0~~gnl/MRDRNA2_/MRDRNA2_116217_c0_seq1.p1  ORF type:complete len:997 (-),score=190.92 gnl/MRDRNA2_/MRDRNA2_116217_c0_seq1:263-2809(-)
MVPASPMETTRDFLIAERSASQKKDAAKQAKPDSREMNPPSQSSFSMIVNRHGEEISSPPATPQNARASQLSTHGKMPAVDTHGNARQGNPAATTINSLPSKAGQDSKSSPGAQAQVVGASKKPSKDSVQRSLTSSITDEAQGSKTVSQPVEAANSAKDQTTVDSMAMETKTKHQLVEELTSRGHHVTFSAEEKAVLHGFFQLHDDDESNALALPELMQVIHDIGRTPDESSDDAIHFDRLLKSHDSDGSGELDFDEFISFCEQYYQAVYARIFIENDEDRSGEMDDRELKGVMVQLKSMGFNVAGEDMANLFYKLDAEAKERREAGEEEVIIDWTKFCEIMRDFRRMEFQFLKKTAGFTIAEWQYLANIFNQADVDSSGYLNISEILVLMEEKLLPSAVDTTEEINRIAILFSRMDKDKSCTLDRVEFLRLLRVWSKLVLQGQEIMSIFMDKKGIKPSSSSKEEEGTRSYQVRASTAHFTSGQIDDAKINELRQLAVQYDLEISVLANQWKLPDQEVRCLRHCFDFSDTDGSSQIDHEELLIVLKTLGCAVITPAQKAAFSKTVANQEFSDDLDFPSLVKFLVTYYKACVEEVLLNIRNDGEETGVPIDQIVKALYQVGLYMSRNQAMDLLQSVGGDLQCKIVDKTTFFQMLTLERGNKAIAWREKCGFTDNQFRTIQYAFSEHCDEKDPTIMRRDGSALEALQLLDLCPAPDKLEGLMCALIRLDRKGDGTITFEDFLLLVRHLECQKHFSRSLEEKEKARQRGLDPDAVQMLRQVFNDQGLNVSGKIGFYKVQVILQETGVIRDYTQVQILHKVILEVNGEDKNVGVSFSNFLEILHRFEQALTK